MTRRLIYISDGTLSSIQRGQETNAGQLYRLLEELGQRPSQLFDYDRGVQGRGLRKWLNAASGFGINRSILRGYAFLSIRWRPGTEIYLFGFSRGAYAVRSLAGMVGRMGLLRAHHRGERKIREAFRLYEENDSAAIQAFAQAHCIPNIQIRMIGCWDTVRALGLPYPILSYLAPMATEFHDHTLGAHIAHGYHALAIDEDRRAYEPILWKKSPNWQGRLEQTWFPGAHSDVGGDLRKLPAARPIANLSLNWMLRRASENGLALPEDWPTRFPEDATAPLQGCRRGLARAFLLRQPRRTHGADGTALHLAIAERMRRVSGYLPRGEIDQTLEMQEDLVPESAT
ncbi:MAG: DUF2235 domain-containing protein [Pseudomonadota bacterium]